MGRVLGTRSNFFLDPDSTQTRMGPSPGYPVFYESESWVPHGLISGYPWVRNNESGPVGPKT